jgi:Cys-tRNA(Pro) deacylase
MTMSQAVERVKAYFKDRGISIEVIEFEEGTRTAQMAADAIGTEVKNIVKSLIFEADGQPILVLCSGDKKVDTAKLARLQGVKKVNKADADFVLEKTGFVIGGVPPVAHKEKLTVYIDQNLMSSDRLYAAAGTPKTIFAIDPQLLRQVTGGLVCDVTL